MDLNTLSFFSFLLVFHSYIDTGKISNGEMSEVGFLAPADSMPVVSVLPNQTIFSPFVIEINSQGKWLAHEGELGTVTLYADNGDELATALMKSKDGNWMTNAPADFIAELQWDQNQFFQGTIVFRNNVVTMEGGNEDQSFSVPVNLNSSEGQRLCFLRKEQAEIGKDSNYNYHFVDLKLNIKKAFYGIDLSIPYGIDGNRGSIHGMQNEDATILKGSRHFLAEGEFYKDTFSWTRRNEDLVLGWHDAKGHQYALERVDCERWDQEYSALEQQQLDAAINRGDRSRLKMIDRLEDYGLDAVALDSVDFMELEIDLDGDYQTKEYLLFIIDRMICGSGGCNLFVINDRGEVLSATTVVKMPVYVKTNTSASLMKATGGWKDLYVWSNGSYRQLIYRDGHYPANASLAPAMAEENFLFYPEFYVKVLDYID